MQIGLGSCNNPNAQGIGVDSASGEVCVIAPSAGTTVNVPATGGAVYVDASGNVISPLTIPSTQLINGVSNSTLLLIAAGVAGLLLMGRAR